MLARVIARYFGRSGADGVVRTIGVGKVSTIGAVAGGVVGAAAGAASLSAAEAVGTGDEVPTVAVLELLASLVDKSLVVADDEGGEARYRFLEPIRQYATERLAACGELTIARERHASCRG